MKLIEGQDYYLENGLFVLTEDFLNRRGYCCKNKCRHCPYGFTKPKKMTEWTEISPEIKKYFQENQLNITKYEVEYFDDNKKIWTIFCDGKKVIFEQFFDVNFFKNFVII